MIMWQQFYQWLLKRADKQADNIWLFTIGAVGFFFGMGIMLYSENTLAPSLGQEIIALFGFVLAIIGGFAAIMGYLSLSLLRFLRFTTRERIKTPVIESAEDPITDSIKESTKETGTSQKKPL